jgi:hypothetical protein
VEIVRVGAIRVGQSAVIDAPSKWDN